MPLTPTPTRGAARAGDAPLGGRTPLADVIGADLLVPLVTGATRRLVHLDYAASAPALRSVHDAVVEALPWYSSVHRGAGYTSTVTSERLESARRAIGRFVGGRDDDVVVVTRNTTDALNLLARSLPDGTTVVTLDLEHHANLLPWRSGRVVHVPTPDHVDDVPAAFAQSLDRLPAGRAFVAVTGASNVTGEVLPIAAIAAVAHARGARIAVDAAQLAPHRRVDITTDGIDYVAFSGHKLYAPFGAGALVGRRDWLDAAAPYLAGGGSVSSVTVSDVAWAPAPARHEGGTPNVVGAIAIAAACRAIDTIGWEVVRRHDAALLGHLRDRIDDLDGVRVLEAFGPGSDRIGIVTVTTDRPASLVAAALSAEHGIATRDGAFCAHPFLRRLHGAAPDAAVPNALRLSFGLGSTRADVDAFADALAEIITDGPRWTYGWIDGRLVPTPDPRPRP